MGKSRGRKSVNVEFLNKLKELTKVRTISEFAKRCHKTPSNMAWYLKGRFPISDTVLRSCLENLFDWEFAVHSEMLEIPKKLSELPSKAGIYILYDSGLDVLYVGKATNFRTEIRQALGREIPAFMRADKKLKRSKPKLLTLAKYLSLYEVKSAKLRHNFESLLLRVLVNQTHNTNIGNFI